MKGWIGRHLGLTIGMIGMDELTAWHRLTLAVLSPRRVPSYRS